MRPAARTITAWSIGQSHAPGAATKSGAKRRPSALRSPRCRPRRQREPARGGGAHGIRATLRSCLRAQSEDVTDALNPEPLLRALHAAGVEHIIIGGFT